MRYLILSDIHANLEALEAVLAASAAAPFDRLLILGDLVGYGASPNEVVERVRALEPDVLIRGNHDKVACGIETAENFNPLAAESARWTSDILTHENRAYLAGLARGPQVVDETIEVCHGTPYDEDAYVLDELDALRALETARRPICLFGHTHLQGAFALAGDNLIVTLPDEKPAFAMELEPDVRYLINPGSIGQPRDGDRRAGYALLDSDRPEVVLYRVPYALDLAKRRILAAGLPPALAHRLDVGR